VNNLQKIFKYMRAGMVLPFYNVESLRTRMGWYINLRWLAVFAILVSAPLGKEMFGFNLGYPEIIFTGALLSAINLVYFLLYRHLPKKDELFELLFAEVQIVVDLIILSYLIHYCGGIANPFYFLYLVQVILSGILFPGIVLPYINAALASILLTAWSIVEHLDFMDVYYLYGNPPSTSYVVTALAAFYAINFGGIYIINNFMISYRSLKKVIDEKNSMLESSIEERNKAFRFAAHELKSPVIAIKSSLDVATTMYHDEIEPEALELIERAERRSEQVINMIKEIIAITQINLGIEKPIMESVEYGEWFESITKLHQVYAVDKNIVYKVIPLQYKHYIEIDKSGMEKVLSNLISNAICYTPVSGTVIVKPIVRQNVFGFSVKDTGIGIEKDELEKIFNEFFRSKKAKEMEQIGTGLGLNLVKEIIRINNGLIFVDSTPGAGSIFKVEIPLKTEVIEEAEEEQEKISFLFE
jgi:signal transduction histidine kinase